SAPEVSQTPPRIPGNRESKASITPCTVWACNSISSAPRVYLRNGAGITTFCDMMFSLSDGARRCDAVNYGCERGEFRFDYRSGIELKRVLCLQTISGNRKNGDIV